MGTLHAPKFTTNFCNVLDKTRFWFIDGQKDGHPVEIAETYEERLEIPMADVVSISKEQLLASVQKFNATGQELEQIMQSIRSQIQSMSEWRGDAQVNFSDVMMQWNTEITNVTNVLNE